MKMTVHIIVVLVISIASSLVYAYDPSPLQDICVADLNSKVIVNGFVCKAIKEVTADDFFLSGFNKPSNTMNKVGFNVTNALVNEIPGLNTLGVSLVRLDFAPNGENPPHTHPRATEILTVLEGTLFVGFVLSNQNNNLYNMATQVLSPGTFWTLGFMYIFLYIDPRAGKRSSCLRDLLFLKTPTLPNMKTPVCLHQATHLQTNQLHNFFKKTLHRKKKEKEKGTVRREREEEIEEQRKGRRRDV